MDIKTEFELVRDFLKKEEIHINKCINLLEDAEENLDHFSLKTNLKNHLFYLKNTINDISESSIDKIIKSLHGTSSFQKKYKIYENSVEIRKGMILQTPDKEDFPGIKNFNEFKDIKFYYRDPSVFREGYGLFEYYRGNTFYYVADNKKLYKYDLATKLLKVGVYINTFQYWK